MKTKSRWLIGILTLSILVVASTPSGGADGPYHFLKEIPVGGEGGWDYLSVDSVPGRGQIRGPTRANARHTTTTPEDGSRQL